MDRRGFLGGLVAAFAAPAIIRPGLLMPVNSMLMPPYKLTQMHVHWIDAPGFSIHECLMAAHDRLLEVTALRGLVIQAEPPPRQEAVLLCSYPYPYARLLKSYEAETDRVQSRLDVLCRDYA